MASPIPVAIYGKDSKISEAVREKLLPDIEIVHSCTDLDAAVAELPQACAGNLDGPISSGLGTNATKSSAAERKAPVAVFFGGNNTDEEYEKITTAVKAAAPNTQFIEVKKRDVLAAGSFGPNPDTIAKIYRKKMAALAAA